MSELKAGVIVTPHDEGMCFNTDSDVIAVKERETKFYLKTEADTVIAGLNDEIHNLKRALIIARHEVAKARGKKSSTKKYIAKYSMRPND